MDYKLNNQKGVVKHFFNFCQISFGLLLLVSVFLLLFFQIAILHLHLYKDNIEKLLTEYFKTPVTIGNFDAAWHTGDFKIHTFDLKFPSYQINSKPLSFQKADLNIDVVKSLFFKKIILKEVAIQGVKLRFIYDEKWYLEGFNGASDTELDVLAIIDELFNLPSFSFTQLQIEWLDKNRNINAELPPIDIYFSNLEKFNLEIFCQKIICLQLTADKIFEKFSENQSQAFIHLQGLQLPFWIPGLKNIIFRNGYISADIWLDMNKGEIKDIVGDFSFDNLYVYNFENYNNFFIQHMHSKITFDPHINGGTIALQVENINSRNFYTKPFHFHISYAKPNYYQYYFSNIDINTLKYFFAWWNDQAIALDIKGELQDIYFITEGKFNYLKTKISYLGIKYQDIILDNIEGILEYDFYTSALNINIDSPNPVFKAETILPKGINIKNIKTHIFAKKINHNWQVKTDEIILKDENLNILGKFNLKTIDNIELHGELAYKDFSMLKAKYYLPHTVIGEHTIAWLERAFEGGEVETATLVWDAIINSTTLEIAQSNLLVEAIANDITLFYAEDWPKITHAKIKAIFNNEKLTIDVAQGNVLGNTYKDIKVEIPNLLNATLFLHIDDVFNIQQNLKLIQEVEPLNQALSFLPKNLKVNGNHKLELNVKLPLAEDALTEIAGNINFYNVNATVEGYDFKNIQGGLSFTRFDAEAKKIKASWKNQDFEIKFAAKNNQVSATLTGNTSSQWLEKYFNRDFSSLFSGSFPWKIQVNYKNNKFDGDFSSNLKGFNITVPEPFYKTAQQSKELFIKYIDNKYQDHFSLSILYDKTTKSLLNFTPHLSSGDIAFADSIYNNTNGLTVHGWLAKLDTAQWYPVIAFFNQFQDSSSLLKKIQLHVQKMAIGSALFDNVKFTAEKVVTNWKIKLKNSALVGNIIISPNQLIAITLDKLHITHFKQETNNSMLPTDFPSFSIYIKDFLFQDLKLKEISATVQAIQNGIEIRNLLIQEKEFAIKADGKWLYSVNNQHQTHLNIQFAIENLASFLKKFQLGFTVENGKGIIALNLQWYDALYNFSWQNLLGSGEIKLKKGNLIAIKPGIGRLLGLFSLNFKDAFGEGLFFNKMTMKFRIINSDLYSENFILDTDMAILESRGRLGISAKDYDQIMTLKPKFTASIPITAAIGGGLPAGAIAWLVHKIFGRTIENLVYVKYQLSGNWDNPIIEVIEFETQDTKESF